MAIRAFGQESQAGQNLCGAKCLLCLATQPGVWEWGNAIFLCTCCSGGCCRGRKDGPCFREAAGDPGVGEGLCYWDCGRPVSGRLSHVSVGTCWCRQLGLVGSCFPIRCYFPKWGKQRCSARRECLSFTRPSTFWWWGVLLTGPLGHPAPVLWGRSMDSPGTCSLWVLSPCGGK